MGYRMSQLSHSELDISIHSLEDDEISNHLLNICPCARHYASVLPTFSVEECISHKIYYF